MKNGGYECCNLKPMTSQLLWILFFRKRIMWLAPHSISIWLDLRTPNLLQSKTLNTKSRQGTGTLTSPTAETGQQLRILAFSSQRSGFWSLASRPSRLDPQLRSAWKRCSFDLARSRALFCAASFVIAGQGPPPTSKFWMDLKLRSQYTVGRSAELRSGFHMACYSNSHESNATCDVIALQGSRLPMELRR